eukprot:m.54958 g.54958  ORF g.54958 m.54958 type:complete len:78 (-) comp6639_c1_seq1:892-1125(-)
MNSERDNVLYATTASRTQNIATASAAAAALVSAAGPITRCPAAAAAVPGSAASHETRCRQHHTMDSVPAAACLHTKQ